MTILLEITPVPKPRQTRADKWKKRPAVMRYRAFADELRLKLPRDVDLNGRSVEFTFKMPKSWSRTKKAQMDGTPHLQTPDLDNTLKALIDAHLSDDSGIWSLAGLTKRWGYRGSIRIW